MAINTPWSQRWPTLLLLGAFSFAGFSSASEPGPATPLSALSLPLAQQLAQQNNRDLRLARVAVQSAAAGKIIAGAAPNPVLSWQTGNINPQAGIGSGSLRSKTVDSTVRIDQLIERGGKRGLRLENASHLEQAARLDEQDTARQLRAQVAKAYYDVLAGGEREVILTQNEQLYQTTLAAARKRQQAGDLAAADVARLELEALRAQNDLVATRLDARNARIALATLLGQPAQVDTMQLVDGWPPAGASVTGMNDVSDVIRAARIEQRPDVMAARARLAAADAARQLALASRTRDITIGVQAEHFPASAGNSQGSGNSYGISLQVPLFVRYGQEGEIRAAELACDKARETLEKVREQAQLEVLQNIQQWRTALVRWQRFESSLLPAAQKSADAAEFAFRHGASNLTDVLDARRTWRATLQDALAARLDYAKSWAAWQAAFVEEMPQ